MNRIVTMTVAILAGGLLGGVDLLAQRTVPYPWAELANSAAVWALAAFAIGMWVRNSPVRAAVAGIVLLLVAVESYYLWAVLALSDSASTLWSPSTQMWLVLAVLAGALFGAGGALVHHADPWLRGAAAALVGIVFLLEAAYVAQGSMRSTGLSHLGAQTIMIEVGLAAVLPPLLLAAAGHRRNRAGAEAGRR